MSHKVKIGLIGSGFISTIHAEALKRCTDAEVLAVASASPGKAGDFARKHGIPPHFADYRRLLYMQEIDLTVVGAPNDVHC